MVSLIPTLRSQAWDGVIVAAFGDPGLADLRAGLDCPVTGIAEAGMAVGGADGRAFAVVTTTQDLSAAISDLAAHYGHGDCFCGVALTDGDPAFVMADPERLLAAMDASGH
jgi:Asp/Glu/hydantoin racemase